MMKKFILKYRALDCNYKLELEAESLNDVLLTFSRNFNYVEKVYCIREKKFSDTVNNSEYRKLMNIIKPR
jgi:hypothetical protein